MCTAPDWLVGWVGRLTGDGGVCGSSAPFRASMAQLLSRSLNKPTTCRLGGAQQTGFSLQQLHYVCVCVLGVTDIPEESTAAT